MKKIFGFIVVLILATGAAFGQAITATGGSIQGDITDATGAKIPNATVQVTQPETGYVKNLTTDSSGFFSIGPLNPGPYKLSITSPGFQTTVISTVVRTGTVTSGDYKLTVGKTGDVIEVNAGAVQVNTEQIAVSDVITTAQIDSLPVNGRNFLDIAQIEPGVVLQSGSSFDPTKSGYSAISIGGVSGRTTRILLDGQDITDEFVGTTIFNVSQGSIGEFQLNRSTQDVSGDVTTTGQVLVSTRSGTNKVHGMAFYNFQDYRSLFANGNFGAANPQFQRNQYGGSVGGPIIKDKLFFFVNGERIQQAQSAPVNLGPIFAGTNSTFGTTKTVYGSPYKETYEAGRLDWNGPFHGHYFARGNYNFNGSVGNFGAYYSLYTNRDNTYGFTGGADFAPGKFTHSFRGGYEKFHNFIADATKGNSGIYNPIPSETIRYTGQLTTGPNVDAPQGTFQSDKQLRYDGTYTYKNNLFKFGGSMNRIESASFAAFFGLAPRATESKSTLLNNVASASNPNALGCGGVAGTPACPGDPTNGYDASSVSAGNGLGFSTAEKGFGLNGGGTSAWRAAGYFGDSIKATPNLAVSLGVRWSVDTNRENNDLTAPTCANLSTTYTGTAALPTPASNPCAGQAPTTSLFTLFNPSYGGKVRQPYANFAPQVGVNYSPGNHKTSLRAGFGIYYESVVFNNTSNARNSLLASGPFFDYTSNHSNLCSSGQVAFPDGTTVTSVNASGAVSTAAVAPAGYVGLSALCKTFTIAQSAPYFVGLQNAYQASTKVNSTSTNGAYLGNTLNAGGLYGPNYKTPYSEQWNFGIQREIFKGAVLSADYIHNSTLKIGQTSDLNHLGAARNFNKGNASAAVAAVITKCGGGTVNSIIQPGGCLGLHPQNPATPTVRPSGASLNDFAANGLDSVGTYVGTSPYIASAAKPVGPAFTATNPLLGSGAFIQPIGRSGYDAFQLVFKQQKSHPAPFIDNSNVQISYDYSRIVSTAATSDEFFSNGVYDNDQTTRYIGRSGLDRTHQLSFGAFLGVKYGAHVGIVGHFSSAGPGNLTLDTEQVQGGIFQTDVTGDGTVGDIAPGTNPGAYMHQVNGSNIQGFISNYNATQAGKLTPSGQQLVGSGLFTQAQLTTIGAVVQPLANLPQSKGLNNPAFRSMDLNVSYPIRLARFREGLSLEPSISFYNVGNFSNFGNQSTVLLNGVSASGALNDPTVVNTAATGVTGLNNYQTLSPTRLQRGSGTFDQGAPRSTEYGLKLNF